MGGARSGVVRATRSNRPRGEELSKGLLPELLGYRLRLALTVIHELEERESLMRLLARHCEPRRTTA